MHYIKVHDIDFKECEDTDWTKTNVLEIIFKHWEEKLRVLIKDAEKEHIDKLVWHAKKKARVHFNNINNPLIQDGTKG